MAVNSRTAAIVTVAALVGSFALAGSGCSRRGDAGKDATEQSVTLAPEDVAAVEVQTLAAGPGLSGTLRAKREAELRAEVGGTVVDVLVDAGEPVAAGRLLGRIADSTLQQQRVAAQSSVAAAKNAVQVAEANGRRARALAEAGALAPQQAEQADAALEAARAQLADAEARVSVAAEQATKARVRAPFAGVVAQRHVSVGDVVAPGAALFTVIDPRRLQFEARIPAARLREVRPGTSVDFSVTGFGDERIEGAIERIAPAVDATTGQVRVYVEVPNEQGRILSGLYAQGRVVHRTETGPAAPADAVDLSSTPPTVLRVAGGRVERVAVRVGIEDEVAGAVAINSGVRAGDVLVRGAARATLAEGTAVKLAGEDLRGEPASAQDGGTGAVRRGALRRSPEDR